MVGSCFDHACLFWKNPVYPQTAKGDVVDDYFGAKVADPYRWLEDDNADETKAWVQAENKVTFGYLESIPQRLPLRETTYAVVELDERFSAPFKRGGYYFFTHNTGPVRISLTLYVTTSPDTEPRLLLDLNEFSKDGTVSLSALGPSKDGKLLAYGLSKAGSDWEKSCAFARWTPERIVRT